MIITANDLKVNTVSEKNNVGVFEFEPLPKGFGYTLGNTLRRVLMTSLEGAAVTQIKIKGVDHQFSTIPGVKEDVVEIILNLKQLRFKLHSKDPEVATIKVSGQRDVTAEDIETTADIELINTDLHIATLTDKNAKFEMELIIEHGTGYSPMEDRETQKVGVIVIDSIFSPVIAANMRVTETRSGARTDLDKLILTVETDGSVKPSVAVMQAAKILFEFFHALASWNENVPPIENALSATTAAEDKASLEANTIAIDDLPLATRTVNALKKHGIDNLAQLAALGDEELADIKNLGEKSLTEIKKLLEKEGLKK